MHSCYYCKEPRHWVAEEQGQNSLVIIWGSKSENRAVFGRKLHPSEWIFDMFSCDKYKQDQKEEFFNAIKV